VTRPLAGSRGRLAPSLFVGALLLAGSGPGSATAIYRCGSEYTNQPTPAQTRDCERITGPSPEEEQRRAARAPAAAPGSARAGAAPAAPLTARVEPADQRQRDAQARLILEAELRKAQLAQAQLQREAGAAPAPAATRAAEIRASMLRIESDIASLQRELSRLGSR